MMGSEHACTLTVCEQLINKGTILPRICGAPYVLSFSLYKSSLTKWALDSVMLYVYTAC